MAVTAKLYRDDRLGSRQWVSLDGTLRDSHDAPFDVTINSLSMTGFRVPAVTSLALDGLVSLGLTGVGMRQARVVRLAPDHYGCEFLAPLSDSELQNAVDATVAIPARFPLEMRPGVDGADDSPRRLAPSVRIAIITAMALLAWMLLLAVGLAVF